MELKFWDIFKAAVKFSVMAIPAAAIESMSEMPKGLLLMIAFVTIFIFAFINMLNRWSKYDKLYQLLTSTRLNLAPLSDVSEGEQMLLILAQQVDQIEANASEWQRMANESVAKAEALQSELQELRNEYETNVENIKANAKRTLLDSERNISEMGGRLNELRAKYATLEAKYIVLESGSIDEKYAFARRLINSLNPQRKKESASL